MRKDPGPQLFEIFTMSHLQKKEKSEIHKNLYKYPAIGTNIVNLHDKIFIEIGGTYL